MGFYLPPNFRAISAPFQGHFWIISGPFPVHFRAIYELTYTEFFPGPFPDHFWPFLKFL